MCASIAPMPTITLVDNPSVEAHSFDKFPAALSAVYVFEGSFET